MFGALDCMSQMMVWSRTDGRVGDECEVSTVELPRVRVRFEAKKDERGVLRLAAQADLRHVTQVGADGGQVDFWFDADGAQRRRRPDAAPLQQLRRVEGAGAQHHLAQGAEEPDPAGARLNQRPREGDQKLRRQRIERFGHGN